MKHTSVDERREQIVNIIRQNGRVETETVAKLFEVSTETIRQDFKYLEKKGILEKNYGGATLSSADEIAPLLLRQKENFLAKDKIARKAMEFIPEGDGIICMDTGSTVALLAAYLSQKEGKMIVTNSYPVMHSMVSSNQRLFALGGEYNKYEMSYQGEHAIEAMQTLTFDLCIMGTSGMRNREGICAKGFQEIRIKKEYMKRSNRKMVLADSSKFSKASLVEIAPWSEIDILITDSGIADEDRKKLENILQLVVV